MTDRLTWRYQRNEQVLYVRLIHQDLAGYCLTWSYPDGTSRTVRMGNVARLYDSLNQLEDNLGADGWELLPVDQRAPNRLPTPTCELCAPGKPVVTAARTATHVHFQCMQCLRTWVVPKPGIDG